MSYHDKIMNLPCRADDTRTTDLKVISIHYKNGHKDARHEAALIASEADEEIQNLRHAIMDLRAGLRTCKNTSTSLIDQYANV